MKSSLLILGSAVALVLAGCASTTVTQSQSNIGNEKLARPDRIVVYDFAGTSADLPRWAAAAGRHTEPSTPPTREQVEAGRKLGAEVAKQLVAEIREMGLPAEVASDASPLQEGDMAIVGYFESLDEGSMLKRVAIGFGSGSAELKTRVEGYEMTASGPRLLGSREIQSGGGANTPGLILPVAVTIATANPIGLAVGGAVKAGVELSGYDTIEGAAKRTAEQVAEELKKAFQRQGWI